MIDLLNRHGYGRFQARKCCNGWAVAAELALDAGKTAYNIYSTDRQQKRAFEEAQRARDWADGQRYQQNQWNLEMWNRENEYNTPQAQFERFSKLGFSPMAFLENQGSIPTAGSVQGASTPSAPQADIMSPPQVSSSFSPVQAALAWKQLQNETLRVENEGKNLEHQNRNLDSDADKKLAEASRIRALQQGEIDLQGVLIKFHGAKTKESEENQKAIIKSVEEADKRIGLLVEQAKECRARTSLTSWREFCERQKQPKEIMLLGEQILLTRMQRYGQRQDNINKWNQGEMLRIEREQAEWYDKRWYKTVKNAQSWSEVWREQQTRGKTKAPALYVIDNAMETTENVIKPFVDVFSVYLRGASSGALSPAPSVRNPIGFRP